MTDQPHQSSTEIERTLLLDGLPRMPANARSIEIEQGYLPEPDSPTVLSGEVPTGRIRRTLFADGRVVCTHTIKQGSGIERTETERTISEDTFARLWPHTEGRRLSKTRWLVQDGDYTWEVDAFREIPLHLAEVEIAHRGERPPIPAWLKPHVIREVTDEKQYRNYELALRLATERQ